MENNKIKRLAEQIIPASQMQIITRWNHINERRLSSQLVFGFLSGGRWCWMFEGCWRYFLGSWNHHLVQVKHFRLVAWSMKIITMPFGEPYKLQMKDSVEGGLFNSGSAKKDFGGGALFIPVEGNWLSFSGELFQQQWKCRHQTTLLRASASSAIVQSVPFQPKRRSLTTMWGGRWDLQDNLIIIWPKPLSWFNLY